MVARRDDEWDLAAQVGQVRLGVLPLAGLGRLVDDVAAVHDQCQVQVGPLGGQPPHLRREDRRVALRGVLGVGDYRDGEVGVVLDPRGEAVEDGVVDPHVYMPNFPAGRLASFTVKTTAPSIRICRLDPTATTRSW